MDQFTGRLPSWKSSMQIDSQAHPELTGGIIATSSPSLITTAVGVFPKPRASSISIYSRFKAIEQLSRTPCFMPKYFDSRNCDSFAKSRGAGKSSNAFLVKLDAEAKYRIRKCPGGGFPAIMYIYTVERNWWGVRDLCISQSIDVYSQ